MLSDDIIIFNGGGCLRSIDRDFSTRFRSLRRESNMTQEEMLKAFNKKYNRAFTAAAISQYENGKRIPEIDALIDFADFFNVSSDYLLGRTNIKTKATQEEQPLSPKLKKLLQITYDLPDADVMKLEEIAELLKLKHES